MDEKKVRENIKRLRTGVISMKTVDEIADDLEQALAPKSTFYKGQQVLLRNPDISEWIKGVLISIKHKSDPDYPYFTSETNYQECKPDPDAVSIPNWIEHDGSDGDGAEIKIAKNELLVVIYEDAQEGLFTSASSGMQLIDTAERYCIIPLPEWID